MRLKVSKSKNSTSFYVTKSVYINKKEKTITVEKLGTEIALKEKLGNVDILQWAKDYVAELNRLEKEGKEPIVKTEFNPSMQIDSNKKVSFNGGYLFLQDIYNDLKIPKICKEISQNHKFEYDLDSILSRLIYSRIMYPCSKLATNEISKGFIEKPNFELHHIYRALDILSEEMDLIQSSLYKTSIKLSKRNTGILYYDCTNFFFETEEEEGLKRYGKSKENRPNPIVQMGLFIDGDGIPLAFNINKGNTNEQITLKPLEEKILSDFELSKFIVCTDAGLSGKSNKLFNSKKDRAFITTQSIKKLDKTLKEWALNNEGWYIEGDNSPEHNENGEKIRKTYDISSFTDEEKEKYKNIIFYKQRWVIDGRLEQNLIVTFSLKYQSYQRKIRNQQLERARKLLDKSSGKYNKKHTSDPKRFIKAIPSTDDGEVATNMSLTIDYDLVSEEEKYDGIYAVYTNLEDEPKEIVKANKWRWQVEECFRIMKSEFEARPVYLKKDNRIEAHFLTCFISLLLYRLLEKKMGEKYTTNELISTLKNMNFLEVEGEGYIPTYERTDVTDDLHENFGFRTDYQIVTLKNMKKIIKISKM